MARGNLKSHKHCFLPIWWGIPSFRALWFVQKCTLVKNFIFVSMEEGQWQGRYTAHKGTRLFTPGKSSLPLGEHHVLMFIFFLCGKQFVSCKTREILPPLFPFFVCLFVVFLILYRFCTKQPLCALESIVHGRSCLSPALRRYSDSEMFTAYASLKL